MVALKVGSRADVGTKLDDEEILDSDETGVIPGAV